MRATTYGIPGGNGRLTFGAFHATVEWVETRPFAKTRLLATTSRPP
jgi:hypothetical protein